MISNFHIPGRPKTPEPSDLVFLASSLHHPDVERVGVTTTPNGDWALLAIVKPGVPVPLKEIEEKALKYPVIYQEDSGRMQVARPAYPDLGE